MDSTMMTIVSFSLSVISVLLIIAMNWTTLKKLKRAEKKEEELACNARLSKQLEETEYGQKILQRLEGIAQTQELYNKALVSTLRNDLLSVTDEVLYINRKRNTKSSKWYSLATRRERFELLEEIMDCAFDTYKMLGGNHIIEDRYKECKAIIKEAKKQAEE